MLPARHRLRSSADFTATLRHRNGARSADHLMVVHLRRGEEAGMTPPRVGFVVPKAVGGAVVRSRVKRRLRAQSAALVSALPAGSDVVVCALPEAAQASSATLRAALESHLCRVVARSRGRAVGPRAAR